MTWEHVMWLRIMTGIVERALLGSTGHP